MAGGSRVTLTAHWLFTVTSSKSHLIGYPNLCTCLLYSIVALGSLYNEWYYVVWHWLVVGDLCLSRDEKNGLIRVGGAKVTLRHTHKALHFVSFMAHFDLGRPHTGPNTTRRYNTFCLKRAWCDVVALGYMGLACASNRTVQGKAKGRRKTFGFVRRANTTRQIYLHIR